MVCRLLAAMSALVSFVFALPNAAQYEATFTHLEQSRLAVLPRIYSEPPHNSSYRELADYWMQQQRFPTAWDKRYVVYRIMTKAEERHNQQVSHVFASDASWNDLTLVTGSRDERSVLSAIDYTETAVGTEYLASMLVSPTDDHNLLRARQAAVHELVTNTPLRTELTQTLRRMAAAETMLLSFWWQHDFFGAYSAGSDYSSYFGIKPLADVCNHSPTVLAGTNAVKHATELTAAATCSVAAVLTPWYIASRYSERFAMPESVENYMKQLSYLGPLVAAYIAVKSKILPQDVQFDEYVQHLGVIGGGVLSGFMAMESVQWSLNHFVHHRYQHEKMIAIAQYFNALETVQQLVYKNRRLREYMPAVRTLHAFFNELSNENAEFKELLELLKTTTFVGDPSLFHHKGRMLVAYRCVQNLKEQLEDMQLAVGEVDAYVSVANLVHAHYNTPTPYCFVEYEHADAPHVSITGLWHPMITSNAVVTNDLELGGMQRRNVLITGPNEGGKSTTMRAAAVAVVLAQTFGIAPAQAMKLTLFSSIGTYLTMEDNLADGHSLFRAEAIRAQELVDRINSHQGKGFCFTVIDELFRGTSPLEGQAAAYSVAKHVGQFSNSLSLVTTHFDVLTSLEHDTNFFANYKVSVICNDDGSITRTFKLEPGISHQHVALDVLYSQGLAGSVVNEAREMIKNSA